MRVEYEFVAPDPAEAVGARRELDRVFDALFDMVLKAESNTPDSHEMCKENKAFPASKSTVDNSA